MTLFSLLKSSLLKLLIIAVFTQEANKSSGWTNCLRSTRRLSVKTGRTNFQTNKPSEFVRLWRRFVHPDEQVDLSTTRVHTNRANRQTICSSIAWKRPTLSGQSCRRVLLNLLNGDCLRDLLPRKRRPWVRVTGISPTLYGRSSPPKIQAL